MDPRRIQKTGTQGLAQKHKDNRSKIGSFQKQGTGGVQLPHISCFRLSNQSVADNTWVKILFDYQEIDNYSIQSDIGASDFRFDAETSGFWFISLSVTFNSNSQHTRELRCLLNNLTKLPQSSVAADASAAKAVDEEVTLQSNFMVSINEGDFLEVQVYQDSNSTINVKHASFQGFKIGS